MAWLLRRPLLIHEQNSVAGLTIVCWHRWHHVSWSPSRMHCPHGLNHSHRQPAVRARLPKSHRRVNDWGHAKAAAPVGVGGSLGAQALNETVPQALAQLSIEQRPEVRHQSGTRHIDAARAAYQRAGVAAQVDAFVDDMAAAYAWDTSRSVPCRRTHHCRTHRRWRPGAILVPYPHACR